MPNINTSGPISDAQRDAAKYYQLLLSLEDFTQAIQQEKRAYSDIDGLLRRLLPNLAEAMKAQVAFTARLPEVSNGLVGDRVELVDVYPNRDLNGYIFISPLIKQLFEDRQPRVITELETNSPPLIAGLEPLEATSAVLVLIETMKHKRVVGICNRLNAESDPFLVHDRLSLAHLVEMMAIGIRIEEYRGRELERLQRASAILSTYIHLKDLLPKIAEQAALLFQAEATSVMLWDKSRTELVITGHHDLSARYVREQRISQEVVKSKVQQLGEMQPFVTDLRQTPFGNEELIRRENLSQVLVAPLMVGETLLGILNLYNKQEQRTFSSFEMDLIQVFANQIAVTIRNAQHYETAFDQVQRLNLLLEASGQITGVQPMQDELPAIVFDILSLGYDAVVLYPYNPYLHEFDEPLIETTPGIELSMPSTRRDSPLWNLVRHAGPSQYFSLTPAADSKYFPHLTSDIKAAGYICLDVEMQSGTMPQTVGLLFVYKNQENTFSDDEVKQTPSLAKLAAQAIYRNLILQSIVDTLREAMHFDLVMLWPYDPQRNELGGFVFSGLLKEPSHLSAGPPSRVARIALSGNAAYFTNDSQSDLELGGGAFVHREDIKSSGYVRLEVNHQPVGILFVNWRESHEWTDEKIHAVKLFANQAAIAIWNGRLYDDLKRRNRHWQAIHEASKAITSGFTTPREGVLFHILQQTVELVTHAEGAKAKFGVIQLYDKTRNELVFESVYPPAGMESLRSQVGTGHSVDPAKAPSGLIGITGRAFLQREAQLVPNVNIDPDYLVFNPSTRSELAIPLIEGEEAIGVLSVESETLSAFNEEDMIALKDLAELAVIAINNARQHEALQNQIGRWGALSQAGTVIARAEYGTDNAYHTIVEQAVKVTGSIFGTLQLVRERADGRWLEFVAAHPKEHLELLRQEVNEMQVDGPGITALAVRKNDAQLIPDVSLNADYVSFESGRKAGETKSELAVVFRSPRTGQCTGVLNVEHAEVNGLDESAKTMLIALADLAAVVWHTAEQAAELHNTNMVAVMGAWGADIAHDLNNQIGNIRRARLRLSNLLHLDDSKISKQAKLVLQEIDEYAAQLALPPFPDQVPDPGDLLDAEEAPEIDETLRSVVSDLPAAQSIQFVTDMQCPTTKTTLHEQWLRRVTRHLINNAIKAITDIKENGTVIVRTRLLPECMIEVQIEDDGKGVRPEIIPYLFKQTIRHAGNRTDEREGRGLLLVRYVVEQYGGNVYRVWSEEGKGSCFAFRVPVAVLADPLAERG